MAKLKSPNVFLKTNFFKSRNNYRTSKKCSIKIQSLREPIALVINETKSGPHKKQIQAEAQTSKIINDISVQGNIILGCYLQEL